jgi:hypothetical protein
MKAAQQRTPIQEATQRARKKRFTVKR